MLQALLAAGVYVAFARLAASLTLPTTFASAFWPAAGWALFAAWRFGRAGLLGVALGTLTTLIWHGSDVDGWNGALRLGRLGLWISVGTTLQAWLGAHWTRATLVSRPPLSRPSEVLRFVAAMALTCATSATIAISGTALSRGAGLGSAWNSWTTWYLGDLMGVLTLAPALLWFGAPQRPRLARQLRVDLLGAAMVVSLMIGVSVLWPAELDTALHIAQVLFVPTLLWVALRAGQAGVALMLPVASLVGYAALALRIDDVALHATREPLLLQLFLGVLGVAGLVLAAALEERSEARSALAAARDALELRVAERTADLESANRALQVEIQDRIRAEEARRASEARLSATVEHLPFDFWVWDRDGRCVMQNRVSVARWGAVVGKHVDELNLDQRVRERWGEHHRKALAGQVVVDSNEIQVEGRLRSYESVVAPVSDGGAISGVLGFNLDVSERRELETQLLHAQKMDSIGRLAGGVAHDFNNLLTAIMGYAEIALRKLGPEHEETTDLMEIRRAAQRAAELTRQLLVFSRPHAARPRVLEVDSLVRSVQRLLRRVIGEHIELEVQLGSNAATVFADASQLEQVLVNLAVNARDAMPGGGRLRIATSTETRGAPAHSRHVQIEVSDTGSGIPAQHLERIFEPFFTTKEEGAGTGLGLATAYAIVHGAGGDIRVESREGQGTTFRVTLPASESTAEPAAPLPHAYEDRGHETLLVVEDESLVRRILASELRSQGYTVLEAGDGEEGLRAAREFHGRIDALLTDLVMPRMGGADLARVLSVERPNLRVLFASGYAAELRRQEPGPGFETAFLGKPFEPTDVTRSLRELLDRRPQARTLE